MLLGLLRAIAMDMKNLNVQVVALPLLLLRITSDGIILLKLLRVLDLVLLEKTFIPNPPPLQNRSVDLDLPI
jgi:hypothetical protein